MFAKISEEGAFTLVEVIISIFIITVVLLGAMSLFTNSTLLVGTQRERAEALNEASSVIEDIKAAARMLENDGFHEDLRSALDNLDGLDIDWHDSGSSSSVINSNDHPIGGFENEVRVNFSQHGSKDDLLEIVVTVEYRDGSTVSLSSLITGFDD